MTTTPPNILFVILDTTRRDHLSAYGYPRSTTPRLDAFAAEAIQFERAISPAHWTIPVHASLFSGQYASTHQVTQANSQLAYSTPTLAELLTAHGYHSVAFCNNPLVGVLENGLQRGFSEFYNYGGAAPNRPIDTSQPAIRQLWQHNFQQFAGLVTNQFARSQTLFRRALNSAFVPLWTRYINFKGHTSHSINDLIAYWGRYQAGGQEKPLFTFLNLMSAHLPYTPPAPFLDHIAPGLRSDKASARFVRDFNANAARWATPQDPPLTDWQHHALESYYDAEVAYQDHHLGRLFDFLHTSGAAENTLVIIAADHGEGHGEHDLFGHGFGVHQELVHVPLLLYHPDLTGPARQVTTNISTRRLFHTVLAAAGVEKSPHPSDLPLAELSLLNANGVDTDPERGLAIAEAFPPQSLLHVVEHHAPHMIEKLHLNQMRRAVYDGPYKLLTLDDQFEALYQVADDAAETENLGADHSVVPILQQKLTQAVAVAEQHRSDAPAFLDVSDEVRENLRALGYIE